MTLDDETARQVAYEAGEAWLRRPKSRRWEGYSVAIVRAGYAYRDAEVEELRADRDVWRDWAHQMTGVAADRDRTLAKVAELLGSLDLDSNITRPGTAWGSILREALELARGVDESPTEREREHFHIWSELPCKPGECRMEGSPEQETPAEEHVHDWKRRQNITTHGYAMPPYWACECGAAREVVPDDRA